MTKYLPMFDVSWFSRYPDENERVFAGGLFPIRVESVRIVETNNNYSKIFTALSVTLNSISAVKAFSWAPILASTVLSFVDT